MLRLLGSDSQALSNNSLVILGGKSQQNPNSSSVFSSILGEVDTGWTQSGGDFPDIFKGERALVYH